MSTLTSSCMSQARWCYAAQASLRQQFCCRQHVRRQGHGMSFLVPFGVLVCSALWLRGLKSLWARAVVLASLLGLLFVLLPSVTQDKALASLAIYQSETTTFSASVAAQLERGEREAAKKRLLYFTKNQNWATVNDPEALRAFFKRAESADGEAPAAGVQGSTVPASK
jgi:hypothetical protein